MLDPSYFGEINAGIVEMLVLETKDAKTRLQALKTLNLIIALNGEQAEAIYNCIDVPAFLKHNVYQQDRVSVDAAFKFLQNFSGRREFCQRIYDTVHKDLKENARSMLSHQGFEAFISILRWCAPLNKVEAFKNILRTMYFTITMKGVDSLQFPEYIALKTRL